MNRKEKAKIEKRLKMMDILVVTMFLLVIIFVAVMVRIFLIMGSVPDALIVSVFAWCGFEAGAMAAIKRNKDKLQAILDKEASKHERRNDNPDHSSGDDKSDYRSPQKNARRPKIQP